MNPFRLYFSAVYWLLNRIAPKPTEPVTLQGLITKFGAALAAGAHDTIIDEKKLPAPKEKMKLAFKGAAIITYPDRKFCRYLGSGFVDLARFQPNSENNVHILHWPDASDMNASLEFVQGPLAAAYPLMQKVTLEMCDLNREWQEFLIELPGRAAIEAGRKL